MNLWSQFLTESVFSRLTMQGGTPSHNFTKAFTLCHDLGH